MKKNISNLIIAVFLSATSLFSQTIVSEFSSESAQTLSKDTVARLTSFQATCNSDKVYLKWTIVNQHVDGIYIIYRSTDGINYENIGSKAGIGVPISKEIAYFFTDTTPVYETEYYKILHVSKGNSFLTSDKIIINHDNSALVINK